jgi:hypothetical protein
LKAFMRSKFSRRHVVIGGLAATLMVGTLVGTVLARPGSADQDKSSRPNWAASHGPGLFDAFVDKLASRLHLDAKTVREAIVEAKKDMVDEAVKAGRLTPEQGTRIKEHIEKGGGRGPWPHDGPGLQGHVRSLFTAAAEALDLKPEELMARLREGKSMNQIAGDLGKNPAAVKQKLITALEQRLDEAVQLGHMTADRASAMKARLSEHVEALMNRTFGSGQRHPGQRHGS